MAKGETARIGGFRLTARADVPDFRDFSYRPALINLKPVMPVPQNLEIRDQGSKGACTGFALAAVIDRLIDGSGRVSKGKSPNVSARMLYEMAKRHDQWQGEQYEGSSCRGAIKGWYNMGVCRESLYSYDRKSEAFSVKAAKDARNNTIGAYYRLGTRISDYHAALNEVGAIFCSADIHDGWESPARKSGLIKYEEMVRGAHAFAIVGYDDEGFWIQNSWGKSWARDGTALWTYEDWRLNIRDAWVFRMGLPTPQIWHLPVKGRPGAGTSGIISRPTRAEIAGHFVHLDDGHFHDNGRYWSDHQDVKLTADLVADSKKYKHLLFYAHGGLNSPGASAKRIAAMKETWKANKVYPFHLMYDTGLLEELKDVIIGRRKEADGRAGGLTDWLDRIVEKLTRIPGRALWREMKAGAELPFHEDQAGAKTLAAFVDALALAGSAKKIHLAGHSTGMILLSHLIKRLSLLAPQLNIESVSLMAPAGTLDLFTSHLQPFLKAPAGSFRIEDMAIYNLTDDLEQDDEVTKAYNKSLLYLVSNAFEEDVPERILGMQNYSKLIERRKLPRLKIHYSKGEVPNARVTASESHGGFDNDPLTMNHILKRILRSTGQSPLSEFTKENLKY